jgi:hypothetical protein
MQMRTGRSRSRGPAVLGLLVASAVLFSACGGSGFVYVGSSADKTFFKVPNNWTAYNKQEILVASHLDQSVDSQSAFHFLVGYDSDPQPSIVHVTDKGLATVYPTVLAWVRKLDTSDHETFSLSAIRNAVYPVDGFVQSHLGEVLVVKDLIFPGGIHGTETIYDLSNGSYSISQTNATMRVAQVGLLDSGTNLFYLFMLRCSADCYSQNQGLIDQIVNSFTVKER